MTSKEVAKSVDFQYAPDGSLAVPKGEWEVVLPPSDDGFVRWETPGTKVGGLLLGKKETEVMGTPTIMYECVGADGNPLSFHGTLKLDELFAPVEIGSYFRLSYNGTVKTNSDFNVKLFTLEVLSVR